MQGSIPFHERTGQNEIFETELGGLQSKICQRCVRRLVFINAYSKVKVIIIRHQVHLDLHLQLFLNCKPINSL